MFRLLRVSNSAFVYAYNHEINSLFHRSQTRKINVPLSTIALKLDETLQALYNHGYRTFLSGMARGFDMLAAEAVLIFRKNHPNVTLIAVIPFLCQEYSYTDAEKQRYAVIYHSADSTIITSEGYTPSAYFIRNDYLIANSSLVVCYYTGTRSGTMYTVNRAQIKRMPILNIFSY